MAPEAGAVVLRLDRRRFDRDGVNLGHLYVAGRLLSCELLRAGLARLDTRPGDSAEISRLLSKAAEEAKRTHAGIWQERFTADSNSDPHHSDDRATFRGSR
jgi:endonuclease YncB( thermonuclease family)